MIEDYIMNLVSAFTLQNLHHCITSEWMFKCGEFPDSTESMHFVMIQWKVSIQTVDFEPEICRPKFQIYEPNSIQLDFPLFIYELNAIKRER